MNISHHGYFDQIIMVILIITVLIKCVKNAKIRVLIRSNIT